jgi:methionine aminopeptidase
MACGLLTSKPWNIKYDLHCFLRKEKKYDFRKHNYLEVPKIDSWPKKKTCLNRENRNVEQQVIQFLYKTNKETAKYIPS